MNDHYPVEDWSTTTTSKTRPVEDGFREFSSVEVVIRDKDGNEKSRHYGHNLRTNGGADFWNTQLFTTAANAAGATFIGITTDATAPAATDTTLASEETTNGLGRAAAGLAHTTGTGATTLTKTFTYTGSTSKVLAKVGLFNAVSAGTMVLETLLASTGTVNSSGDSVSITWQVNF